MDTPTCWIDDFGPLPVLQPTSVAEVGDCVRRTADLNEALYPLGGRTLLNLGLTPTRAGKGVDLRRLDQVIDYPARDMTITVQAGITLARLHQVLRSENQWLPVDAPFAEQATLGGVIAANKSSSRRYGFGTWRDYVIGMSAINDEGQEIKAGGRVVKNVAGYDLCKLFIGSLGTLGILTQITLKLKPRPQEQALVTFACSDAMMDSLLESLHGSSTRPVCIDIFNRSSARIMFPFTNMPEFAAWMVAVGFEENRDAVTWQVQQLIKELAPEPGNVLNVLAGSASEPLWHALTEFSAWPDTCLTFQASVLPSATATFCRQAAAQSSNLLLQAHAGSGVILGHLVGDMTLAAAAAQLQPLLEAAAAARGNLVLLRCPSTWKKTLPVWGRLRGDNWLMRRVKERLDPKYLFNPGRFIDSI